jgi:beta-galactosidase
MPRNSHLEWTVPYESGVLAACGYTNGQKVVSDQIETTGESAALALAPDRSIIQANMEDVSIITVQVQDTHGRVVPTSRNEVIFSLQGPGRIIGIGNGDPSSHEAERFIEQIAQVNIDKLKVRALASAKQYAELTPDYDDVDWKLLINGKGEYSAPSVDSTSVIVIRGEFLLPAVSQQTAVSLWPKSLGEEQTIYVNGQRITGKIRRDDAVQEYSLTPSILHGGKNIFALVGKPLMKRFQYDNLNTDPGIVQATRPADQWRRKVFNGLAQLIVQSTKTSGVIVVQASGEDLKPASVRIQSQQSTVRPSIPEE